MQKMRKISCILCGLLALSLPMWVTLYAQGPALPKQGTVLILDNGRTLEGAIERHGDRLCLRRDTGELWLPTEKVKFLCRDWDEALAIMRSRANLRDPDERLRLAHWCYQNHLPKQAVEEAAIALKMRPGHGPTEHFLKTAERLAAIADRPPPAYIQQTAHVVPPPPNLDLSADVLGLFTTKIQPILMNTCIRCHGNDYTGKFKLLRTYGVADRGQRTTQHNLAVAVTQINLENPVISPLLVKSVSAHGGNTKAPLPSRRSVPYNILREWVEMTVANNPHLREEKMLASANKSVPAEVQAAFASESGKSATTEPRTLPSLTGAPPLTPETPLANAQALPPATVPGAAVRPGDTAAPLSNRPAAPKDEFDPAIFNQQMHPERK
jgi:hypothetical protein